MRWTKELCNVTYIYLIVFVGCFVEAGKLYTKPRLPINLIPYHYDLELLTHLEGDPESFRYSGTVSISLYVHKSTNLVVLHAREVTIIEPEIQIWDKSSGDPFSIRHTEYNIETDYFIIQMEMQLERGRSYVLTLPFENNLSEDFQGGYFIGYNGQKHGDDKSWFTLTQFQRNFIRNVMPSFDEPALRATFNVTLGHHRRFQSFSNMPLLKRFKSDLKDYVWSMHEVSPLIPTYLLAFSINNFTCMYSKTNSREVVSFRTCSHLTDIKYLSVASRIAPKLFQYFENLFQVSCPLRKVEQLAIPHFSLAAMENWGLIFYSDDIILQKGQENPSNFSQSNLQTLQLVAHELAHMWFGDLVTISWWDSLWLNEGLAGYFEAKGVEYLKANFGKRVLFKYREGALMNEMMNKPISIADSTEESMKENISVVHIYQKVTSIIRMLNAMLGDEVFYEALFFYLTQYSFSHTTPDQLWGKMQMSSNRAGALPPGHDVHTIMETWTHQAGYPVLDVSRNTHNNSVFVIQNPCTFNASSNELWWIPLTFTTQSERNFTSTRTKVWLTRQAMYVNKPILSHEWIMFNVQAVGYYRVNYDEHNWGLIASDLYNNHKSIHVLNRAQIVSDCLYLWQQDHIHWLTALNVLKYIIDEDEYEPLVAFVVGVTNGFWGVSPEASLIIAKWLGSAGKWYAEFINYTFNWFVLIENNEVR